MTEHLKSLFNFVVSLEYVTLVVAILLLRKKSNGIWRLFIPMLLFIVLSETSGWYVSHFFHKPNAWIFNINLLVTDVFLIWMLSTAEPLKKLTKRIWFLILLFLVLSVLYLKYYNFIIEYANYTEATGDIILVTMCLYFFYSALKDEKHRDFFTYEYFWLANGVLFSSIIGGILFLFPNSLGAFRAKTNINLPALINNFLNLLLYGSLIAAFICRNRNQK